MSYLPHMKASQQARDPSGIELPCANANCNQTVFLCSSDFFWSPRTGYELREVYCPKCDERANAPMIKPQPKGFKVDGWDV